MSCQRIMIIIILLTMFMVLSSWHSNCESSPGSFDECRLSAGWPPTLRPNQPIWVASPPKDWLLPSADTIAIYYYYSALKLIFILPSHGGWQAESTCHCTYLQRMCSEVVRIFDPVFWLIDFCDIDIYTVFQKNIHSYYWL